MKDDREGDIDCGGSCNRKCTAEQSCRDSLDCETGLACTHNQCEKVNLYVTSQTAIPVLGLCCGLICVFLIIGTFIKHNKRVVVNDLCTYF